MTTHSFPFKVLFCFENESMLIVEIKRTDIQSEDKSVIYKWMIIQKENQSENEDLIKVLTFQSMSQNNDAQIREFAEGVLTWNSEHVHFNNETMTLVEPGDLSIQSLEIIEGFLS